jgi:hypothetical protein
VQEAEPSREGLSPQLEPPRVCVAVLGIPLAERAINEYWGVTPTKARKSGLRLIQQDVLDQRNAVLGRRRNFADAVNAYIERKLEEE